MNILTIVGCGPGDPELLTLAGSKAIASADRIVGSSRLVDIFAPERGEICPSSAAKATPVIEAMLEQGNVCLLVSGDVGCFSLAASFRAHFPAESLRLIPGISSVQLACMRLGIDWAKARVVSVHGRRCAVSTEELMTEDVIVALLGGENSLLWLEDTHGALAHSHVCQICSQLGMADENIHPYPSNHSLGGRLQIAVFSKESS